MIVRLYELVETFITGDPADESEEYRDEISYVAVRDDGEDRFQDWCVDKYMGEDYSYHFNHKCRMEVDERYLPKIIKALKDWNWGEK
jgi:hypothetical protein